MDCAANSWKLCLTNVRQAKRWWTQRAFPLRSVTGAIPACAWSSVANCQRDRSEPKAAARRGAPTAPAPGETGEELGIRMGRKDRGDAGLERLDGLNEDAQLRGVGLHGEPQRVDDGRVGGQGPGAGDLREPSVDDGGGAAVVLVIEPPQGVRARPAHGRQVRPLRHEVAGLPGRHLADPVRGPAGRYCLRRLVMRLVKATR